MLGDYIQKTTPPPTGVHKQNKTKLGDIKPH